MAGTPLYSVNALTTPHNTAVEDVIQVAATGGDGVGLFEGKLRTPDDDERVREALAEHGLRASMVFPAQWTILYTPLAGPDAPRDPKERTELICESIARLAKFDPVAIGIGPGASGDPDNPIGPIDAVFDGLQQIADVAAEHGQRISFELLAQRRGSPLPTLPGIVDFIEETGRDNIGVFYDVYHSWPEPDVHDNLRALHTWIDAVHVNDIVPVERSWCDRTLPGHGLDKCTDIVTTLVEVGYDGWYELEVFSDDGTFGNAFPDSLWAMPHEELLRQGKAAFDRVYAEAQRRAQGDPS